MPEPTGTAAPGRIVVQLVRGLAGTTRYQREVVRGLGLRRPGATASRPDNPMIRGMVRRVPHLVRIVEDPAASAETSDAPGVGALQADASEGTPPAGTNEEQDSESP